MCIDHPRTHSVNGQKAEKFWCTIGGESESLESVEETALREIYEESGIERKKIELGPIVWFGELDLISNGNLTHIKQKFVVAKTRQKDVFLMSPDG